MTFAGHRLRRWSVAVRRPSSSPPVARPDPRVERRASEPLVPLRVLANRTAVLSIVASVAVGIAMFGGTTFLGQYFQVAQGYSPTKAGLMTIPLMARRARRRRSRGQIISRTGRWKAFLVGGGVFLVAGLAGLARCGTTPRLGESASRWRSWASVSAR